MRCLIDTCAWIWELASPDKLSDRATSTIDEAGRNGELHLSVISCWEVAKLVEEGRLRLNIPVRDWIERGLAREGLILVELSPAICVESTELPGEFPGDPADQIILATARRLSLPVITPDRAFRDHPGVEAVW